MSHHSQKDLTPFVDTFFPERNGTLFKPIEGRNFTKETLTYMCPANIAQRVTDGLLSRVPPPKKILIIEVCGGLGGNTCSFLSTEAVGLVISYEKRQDRRLMLKRNVNAYNLGNKCIVTDEEFNGIDLNAASGCAIYFDPPWLPESIPGDFSSKQDYILEGIVIGSKTLEQWLETYSKTVYMMVFRVPPNYKLKAVDGWKYEIEELITRNGNKGRVYYCINTDSTVVEKYITNNGGLTPYQPLLTNPKSFGPRCPLVAYSFIDPEPLTSNPPPTSPSKVSIPKISSPMKQKPNQSQPPVNRPVYAPPITAHRSNNASHVPSLVPIDKELINRLPTPGTNIEPGSAEWIQEFQKYIYELLTLVTLKPEIRVKMVDNNAMPIWIRAWTHETWDSNVNQNYENIETIGDGVVGYAFKCYVFKRIPNITSAGISEYKAQYMSKMHQSPIARELKMGHWVLARTSANVNILEDLFESFSGALHEVADGIKMGLGAVLVRNMIANLFKNVTFDPDMIRGTAKTVITQYAHRLHWGKIVEESFGAGTNISFRVSLSDIGIQHLQQNGMIAPVPLGEGRGSSDKAASDAAYKDALKNLNKIGATHQWVLEQRSKMSFDNLPQDLVAQVRTRASRNGFTIKTVTPRSTATNRSVVVQLIGVKNGEEKILASVTAANEEEGKLKVFQTYATGM